MALLRDYIQTFMKAATVLPVSPWAQIYILMANLQGLFHKDPGVHSNGSACTREQQRMQKEASSHVQLNSAPTEVRSQALEGSSVEGLASPLKRTKTG